MFSDGELARADPSPVESARMTTIINNVVARGYAGFLPFLVFNVFHSFSGFFFTPLFYV